MSKIGVNFSVNLSKLDKSKFFTRKKGEQFLNLTSFIDPANAGQYGDHGFISQAQTKEERDSGDKSDIIGNVKVFWSSDNSHSVGGSEQQSAPVSKPNNSFDDFDDSSIPFL